MKKTTWTPEQIALLGKVSDPRLAEMMEISLQTVANKRYELGIPTWQSQQDPHNHKEYNAQWYQENKDRQSNAMLKKTYGITLAEYDEILEAQGGVCAICGKTPEGNGKRLSVDHDHETGAIRGLLCGSCNLALGMFQDSPMLLRGAINYLGRS